MPGSATAYLQQRVLSHTLAFGAYTPPVGVYVGLTTSPPTTTMPGAEVQTSGAGYVRQPAIFALAPGRADLAINTASLEYAPATVAWGTIGYFELWDAVRAGNRLYFGPLVDPVDGTTPQPMTITAGDIVRLAAGNLAVSAVPAA